MHVHMWAIRLSCERGLLRRLSYECEVGESLGEVGSISVGSGACIVLRVTSMAWNCLLRNGDVDGKCSVVLLFSWEVSSGRGLPCRVDWTLNFEHSSRRQWQSFIT